MPEVRWLSLSGICSVLCTTPDHIWWLVKNGYLESIPGKAPKQKSDARFLDPSAAFAERLRTTEMIYQRRYPLPSDMDIDSKCIFSRPEVALLMGWTEAYARKYLLRNKIPHVKIGDKRTGGLCLYSAKTIRQMIWKKQGRSLTAQRTPFLIPELVELFRRQPVESDFHTDQQVAEDAVLEKKLSRLLKLPREKKEAAIREFWSKVSISKEVVACLKAE